MATIHGTTGNDSLIGTDGDDHIVGQAGDDTILGGAGNDVIYGDSSGAETSSDSGSGGGSGSGHNASGSGWGYYWGRGGGSGSHHGSGSNHGTGTGSGANGGSGATFNDYLDGGAGNDVIFGEQGEDTLVGGAGDDTLRGGTENDVLYGDFGPAGAPEVIAQGQLGTTGTLDSGNFAAFWGAAAITARNVNPDGTLTAAAAGNVGIHADGIGASSDQASGPSIKAETGYDPIHGVSEELIVDFGRDVTDAQVGLTWFFSGENGYDEGGIWEAYDDGVLVATQMFVATSASGEFALDVNPGVAFDALVLKATAYLDDQGNQTQGGEPYADQIMAADAVGYWRLDESSGKTVHDETGNEDGKYEKFKSGDYSETGALAEDSNTAMEFDGKDNYVVIDHDSEFEVNEGTIQLWFKATDNDARQGLFSKDSSGYDDGGHLTIYIENNRVFARMQSTNNTYEIDTGAYSITEASSSGGSQWHHVALTFGSGGMKLYLDGELTGTSGYTGGLGSGNDEPIVLGANAWSSDDGEANKLSDYFDGLMDEVSIHSRALSGEEIAELHQTAIDGAGSGITTDSSDFLVQSVVYTYVDENGDPGWGEDTLYGDEGDDTLNGQVGDDVLYGDTGVGAVGETLSLTTPDANVDVAAVAADWAANGVTLSALRVDSGGNYSAADFGTKNVSFSINSSHTGDTGLHGNYAYSGIAIAGGLDGGEIDTVDGDDNDGEVLRLDFAAPMSTVTVGLSALFDGETVIDADHGPYDAGYLERAEWTAFGANGEKASGVILGTVTGLADVAISTGFDITRVELRALNDGAGASGHNSDFLLRSVEGSMATTTGGDDVLIGEAGDDSLFGEEGDDVLFGDYQFDPSGITWTTGNGDYGLPRMSHDISNIVLYLREADGDIVKVKIDGFGGGIADADDLALDSFISDNYSGADLIALTIKAGNNHPDGYGPGEGELFIIDSSYGEGDLPVASHVSGSNTWSYGEAFGAAGSGGSGSAHADSGSGSGQAGSGSGSGSGHAGSGSGSGSGYAGSGSGSGSGHVGSGSGSASAQNLEGGDGSSFNDYLVGGAGNDLLFGQQGDDWAVYQATGNETSTDRYDGGSGWDVLQLVLDANQLADAQVQQDIANYLDFLAANSNPASPTGQGPVFQFTAFDLKARNFEQLVINSGNQGPIANDDGATADEDNPVTINVLGNDTDPDGDDLTVTGVDDSGTTGTIVLNPNGTVTYTPGPGFEQLGPGETATDSFTYTVSDGNGGTDTATVTVTVTGVNDGPDAIDDQATVGEDSTVNITVLANDSDPDANDTLTVTGVDDSGAAGTVTANPDGTVTYDPGSAFQHLGVGETATDSFMYTITDNHGATDMATVTITVNGANDAPVAVDDSASTGEDEALVISTGTLLGNDYDPDVNDSIDVSAVSGAINGTVSLDTNSGEVTFIPAAGFSGTASFEYTITDSHGATDTATVTITIDPEADDPDLSVTDATGTEDTAIALDISAALTDLDGSETLTLTISGVPSGASLSAGTNQGGGVWSLTPAQASGLTITPPHNSDVDFTLTVSAISTETGNGDTATVTAALNVTVIADADAPTLTASDVSGEEDTAIPLTIASGLTDTDGSESLSITISGVPSGASLSNGTDQGGGVWLLAAGDLAGLTVTPPVGNGDDFTLTVVSTSTEAENGDTASVSTTIDVQIAGMADDPTLDVSDATGNEDTAIALDVSPALTDTDGSETLAITISGVPTGASLSAGSDQGGGVWTLTSAQTAGLTITPPADSDIDFALAVTATSTETVSGDTASASATLNVTVIAVADAPDLTTADATGDEDTAIPLSIGNALTDTDGSESLGDVTISGVPTGASLSAGSDQGGGVWVLTQGELAGLSITPAAGSDADFTLGVSVTSTEAENGDTATTTGTINVTVAAVADDPDLDVTDATGNEDTAIALDVSAALTDTDGSESLSDITISGVPMGASLSAGTDQGGGVWTITAAETAGLTITPPADSDVDFALSVSVTSTEGENGDAATTTGTINVTVIAVADAPTLSTEDATTDEDTPVALDIESMLTDLDGSEIHSPITISGVPTGASLNLGTDLGGGAWAVDAGDLASLEITPAPGSDADFTLTVSVTSTEQENGDTATTTGTIDVVVNAVADDPDLDVTDATGLEDTAIALDIAATLNDLDGSETLSQVTISGVPAGAALSAGTMIGGGGGGGSFTPGSEIQVNTTTASTQRFSSVAGLGDGGFIATWESLNQDGSGYGVYAQRFDAAGNMVHRDGITPGADELRANATTFGNQGGPTVAATLSDGGFVIVWQSSGQDGSGSGLYAQRFSSTGAPIGGEVQVNSYTAGDQIQAEVTGLDGGGFVVTWRSATQDTSGGGIFGKQYDASGTEVTTSQSGIAPAVGNEFLVNTGQSFTQQAPDVVALAGGGYVVVWESDFTAPDSSSFGVFQRFYDAAGTPLGSQTLVNSTTLNQQSAPSVAALAGGGHVVTWMSFGTDGDNWGIYGQRYNAAGSAVGGEFHVSTATAGAQQNPSVTALDDGGFVVVWGSPDASGFGIYGQVYDANGAPVAGEFRINDNQTGDQVLGQVTALAGGGFAVTWDSPDADGTGIMTKVYQPTPAAPSTWVVDAVDLDGLTITPPNDSDADFTLTLSVTSTEGENGDTATTTASLNVTVIADADAPTLSASDAAGDPNTAIPLSISSALTDTDGSESLSITLTGVPTGASLSAGTDQGGGVWVLTQAQLAGLTITPPLDSEADFDLGLISTSTEAENGDTATKTGTLHVVITDQPADPPSLSTTDATGNEDTGIPLDIDAALTDLGEQLSITIGGVPTGASLSAGSDQGGGVWVLTPGQTAGLTITPPADSDVDFTLSVTATSTEPLNGSTASTTANLNVTVNAVADPPALSGEDVTTDEDTPVVLDIQAALADIDSSESLSSVRIFGVPEGASLSAGTFTQAGEAIGVTSGVEFQVNTFTTSTQRFSSIAPLNDGGFIASWESLSQDGSGYGVYSQRFNAMGNPVGAEFRVNTTTFSNQGGPSVAAALGDGGWVVVWTSNGQDGSGEGVYGQRYDVNGVKVGGEFRVNDFTANNQNQPDVQALADGGFVVSWTSNLQEPGASSLNGVFAKQYDSNGNAVTTTSSGVSPAAGGGKEFHVNSTNFANQQNSDVGALSSGGYVVVWESDGQDGSSFGVYDQRYDAAGTKLGGEFRINTVTASSQSSPHVAGLDDGGFVAVWRSFNQDAAGGWGVFGKRYDASGAVIGSTFQVNTTAAGDQQNATVAALDGGGFVVVWEANGQDGDGLGIFAQVYDSDGSPIGTEMQINDVTTGNQSFADVVGLIGGGFLVTWDSADANGSGVFGKVFEVDHGGNDAYWTVDINDLAGLTLTPPADSDEDFTLTLEVDSIEAENNDTATTTASLNVVINPVADDPILEVEDSTGDEDTPIALDIFATQTDFTETLEAITISGVPTGASLSAGTDLGGGVWTVTAGQLGTLTITPPADSDADFVLNVSATTTEGASSSTVTDALTVTVVAVADAPTLNTTDVTADQDTTVPLTIGSALTDTDGSETLSLTISGVPTGASLNNGTDQGGGVWILTPADTNGLTIDPPAGSDDDFTLTVTATSTEAENGDTATTTGTLNVVIDDASAVPPTLDTTDATGNEDTGIPLILDASLVDTDGSESLSLTIGGVPTDASLSAGADQGGGVWILTPAQTAGLTITPPADSDVDFTLSVTATATESNGGATATTTGTIDVTVIAVADAPGLSGTDVTTGEDTPVALDITAVLADIDGSESLSTVKLYGIPQLASLSAGTFHAAQPGGSVTPAGGEFQVNTFTTSAQRFSSIAPLNDGGFVATWESVGQDGSGFGVYAQRFDAGGNAMGAEFRANTTIFSNQGGPSVSAALGDGGWIIVWTSDGQDGSSTGIYGQRYDANGVANGSEFQINDTTLLGQNQPDVQTLVDGGFVVTWTSEQQDGSVNGIYGKRYDSDGNEVTVADSGVGMASGNEFEVNDITFGTQRNSDIGKLTDGGYVVVWESDSTDGSSFGVYAQRYDAAGTAVGAQTQINTTTTNSQSEPRVAGLSDGGYVVTWSSFGQDGSGWGVYGRRYDVSGAPVSGEFQVHTTTAGDQKRPAVAALDGGGFVVVWEQSDGSGTGIYGQVYNADGDPVGGETLLNVTTVNNQNMPEVVGLIGGDFMLTWDSADADQTGVFGRIFDVDLLGTPAYWEVDVADLDGLTLTPVPGSDADLTITMEVTSTEAENGDTASTTGTINVTVNDLADPPSLGVTDATGDEDTGIPLTISSALTDTDGSETLSLTISGVPTGASLSAGSDQGGGVWTLIPAETAGLSITPPADSDVDFTLTVAATSTETDGGDTATVTQSLNVTVIAVADTPTLSASDATGAPANPIALSIDSDLTDTDGSESLLVTISGVPTGASLSVGANQGGGVFILTAAELLGLTITPPLGSDDFTLSVTSISTEAENGDAAGISTTIDVIMSDVFAEPPILSVADATGTEDTAIALTFSASLTDTDGSETLSFTVSGVPTGASLSAGTDQGGGVWTLTPAETAGLTLTPPADSDVDFVLTVTATSTEIGSGDTAGTTDTMNVTVIADADAPSLNATDATGLEDQAVALSLSAALSDIDGSESLSDITISGVPTGVSLSAGTDQGGGVYVLTAAQTAGLTAQMPANESGSFTLTLSVTSTEAENGDTATTTGTLDVTILPVNDAPVAVDDSYSTDQDTVLTVNAASGVLINDSDPFDSPANNLVDAEVQTGPAHGTVTLNDDGSFVYTPDAGYVGADSFTYRVIDDGGTANGGQDTSAPATVSIFVDGVNLPPDALDATLYGLSNNAISSSLGATDPNHDYEDLDFVYETGTGPAHGTVTINPDGTFTYTPDTGFVGIDTFDFRVTDPFGDFDVATITVDLAQAFVPPEFAAVGGGTLAKTPDVVGLPDGGFIIVWSTTDFTPTDFSDVGDGAQDGVFFQRYDSDGNKVSRDGLTFGDDIVQANTTAVDSQHLPRVVSFSDGDWLTLWQSNNQDGSGFGLYGQRYAADGSTIGGEFQLNTSTNLQQVRVRVEVADDDSYTIIFGNQASGDYEVAARRFAADDTPIDAVNFQVNTYTTGAQFRPEIAVQGDGSFVAVWQSAWRDYTANPGQVTGSASAYGIYAQRYDANGVKIGSEFRVQTQLNHQQENPGIVALDSGGFAVVWESQKDLGGGVAGDRDVFLKIYDQNGIAITGDIMVNGFDAGDQIQARVTQLADGSLFVAWSSDLQDADGFGIYGKRFLADGTPAGDDFQINTSEANDQRLPELAPLVEGGFVAVWETLAASQFEQIAGRLFGPNISGMRDLTGGAGNDYVAGSDQADLIDTKGGADQLFGFANDDILIGGAGADYMEGGTGADTFVWNDLSEGSAAGGFLDSIGDFNTAEGDKLDVSAFVTLSGGDDINDFVNLVEGGGNTTVRIDVDGAAGGTNYVSLVLLQGATGLNAQDLLDDENLLVTQI